MRILVTGGGGFLGWHVRCRLHALTDHEVLVATRENWSELPRLVRSCDAVIHLAGVNRADTPELVEDGNVRLATDVADAIAGSSPAPRLIYAGSTQIGNGSPYGRGKEAAGALLRQATADSGGKYTEVRLPGVFGEHARPRYNTFVATFIDAVLHGRDLVVNDNEVELLHVQDAAECLLAAISGGEEVVRPRGTVVRVPEVLQLLRNFNTQYSIAEIPDLPTRFHAHLFNAYRAAAFESSPTFGLAGRSDERGVLVETLRTHGSGGQVFVSHTHPGYTRGQHYHLRKIERFCVLSGTARIALRRLLTSDIVHVDVDGRTPVLVDMPTLWVHSITNTGESDLLTMFWTNELFDPSSPDTYPESVELPSPSSPLTLMPVTP